MSFVFDPPLLTCCPPSHSELSNSLVTSVGCKWTAMLSSWPSNGIALNVYLSLLQSQPVLTMELCGSRAMNGRFQVATCFGVKDAGEIWCFASGKRVIAQYHPHREKQEAPFTSLDLLVRYEVKSMAVATLKNGQLVMILGGPRGFVIQTLESSPRVICFIWRSFSIRVVTVSPSSEYLLALSLTGHVGVWRLSSALTDECTPLHSFELPTASMCCASFSPNEDFFCVSAWNSDKTARPCHYVFQIDSITKSRIFPVKSFDFLHRASKTTRIGPLLPPPPLCVFSTCGRFLAVTSSPSSLHIYKVRDEDEGRSVFKWDSESVEDDIVGLTCASSSSTNKLMLDSVLVIRLSSGKVIVIAWSAIETGSLRLISPISQWRLQVSGVEGCLVNGQEKLQLKGSIPKQVFDGAQKYVPDKTLSITRTFRTGFDGSVFDFSLVDGTHVLYDESTCQWILVCE